MKTNERIYNFVVDFYNKNGYSPTIREIGEAVGLSSPSTVHGHISRLIRNGKLNKKEFSPRTLVTSGQLNNVVEAFILKTDDLGSIEEVRIGDKVLRVVS